VPDALKTTPPAAITYIGLPISSGGAHSLGRMSRRVASERTMNFLRTCTQPVDPITYSFDVHDVPELPPVSRLERELKHRFGQYFAVRQYLAVQGARVDEALDFLDEIDPQPTNQWGMAPIWFTATSKFQILDPATGHPLPGQDPKRFKGVEYEGGVALGTSGLRLILDNHARIAIELCLPDPDDAVLRRVVPWLQEYLPCTLSSKQWRAWTPTKAGSFKARRIPAPGSQPSAACRANLS
jgi:hypothetical protein